MSLIKETEKYLTKLINSLGYDIEYVKLENSKFPEYGEFQINVAMQLAAISHQNPRDIAQKIIDNLDNRFINANIQGPGFINVTLQDEYLLNDLNKAVDNFDHFVDKNEKSKKIILDYGGANIAKELHVGHLRCNIGEAIRRLLILFKDDAISDIHWGDWGTPMGLVMKEIKSVYPDLPYFDPNFDGEYPLKSPVTNEELCVFYPRASKKKEDEEYFEDAKKITEMLQNKDKGIYALWKHIINVSEMDALKIYSYLNCHFDYLYGESDADKYVSEVLDYLEKKGVSELSDGALIMNIALDTDNKNMPPLLLKKSDGAILYDTTELATIYQRVKDFNPDAIWYFTDERQRLHFEQTFRGAKISKMVDDNVDLKFNGFGTINGKDGKPFKTRDGGVMSLKKLIEEVYNKIEPNIKEDIVGDERKNITNKLTVATLKYADLSPNRGTDYIFDVDKFTSFDGKTGIYALYTLTRIKSLLDKNEKTNNKMFKVYNSEMKEILVKLFTLPKVLKTCYDDVSLSSLCDFIYEIANLYNKFYGMYNITNEIDVEKKETFITLSNIVCNVLSNCLNVLGIEEVDKM